MNVAVWAIIASIPAAILLGLLARLGPAPQDPAAIRAHRDMLRLQQKMRQNARTP